MLRSTALLTLLIALFAGPTVAAPTLDYPLARALLGEWNFRQAVGGSSVEGTARFTTEMGGRMLIGSHTTPKLSMVDVYRFDGEASRLWLFDEECAEPLVFAGKVGAQGLIMTASGPAYTWSMAIEGPCVVVKCAAPKGMSWTRTYSRPNPPTTRR